MEEKNKPLVEPLDLRQRTSSQVDFIFHREGSEHTWVDKLLSEDRVSERLNALRKTKPQRNIGVVISPRGPSSHEIVAGTPESRISESLTPGDYLIFLPEDYPSREAEDSQAVLIHEIAHLRKGFDKIDKQLIKNRQELGQTLETNQDLDPKVFESLGIGATIFNYLIDYRLLKWQVDQGEIQDASEFAGRAKRSFERGISRREELRNKSSSGNITVDETIEAYQLDRSMLFNVYYVYLSYFAPFMSIPKEASKRGDELTNLFENAKTAGYYITDDTLGYVLETASEIAKLVDSDETDKERILNTLFGDKYYTQLHTQQAI